MTSTPDTLVNPPCSENVTPSVPDTELVQQDTISSQEKVSQEVNVPESTSSNTTDTKVEVLNTTLVTPLMTCEQHEIPATDNSSVVEGNITQSVPSCSEQPNIPESAQLIIPLETLLAQASTLCKKSFKNRQDVEVFLVETRTKFDEPTIAALEAVLQKTASSPPEYRPSNPVARQVTQMSKQNLFAWKADAVLNPRNDDGYGCPRANHACIENKMHRLAGPRLTNAYLSIVPTLPTYKVGSAFCTDAFLYPSKCIVHVHSPDARKGETNEQYIVDCTWNALDALQSWMNKNNAVADTGSAPSTELGSTNSAPSTEPFVFAMPLISCRTQSKHNGKIVWTRERVRKIMTDTCQTWFVNNEASNISVYIIDNQ